MRLSESDYFASFKGELINTVLMELLIAAAVWKTWFSAWETTTYLICAILAVVLLAWAQRVGTKDAYEVVGKVAFGILILDTFVVLLRTRHAIAKI